MKPAHERVLSRSVRVGECLEYQGARFRYGYGNVRVFRDGKWRNAGAHRVVYEATVGPAPDGMVLAHSCDNPPCVNVEHLTPMTQEQNLSDMTDKGRRSYGLNPNRDSATGRYATKAG